MGVIMMSHNCVGISRNALYKVLEEREKDEAPPAKRYKVSRERCIVDDFDQEAIQRKIYEMYDKKEIVTLDKLLVCYMYIFLC